MRGTMQFWAGVLVGIGFTVFLLIGSAYFFVWEHHMFIMGVSSWPALIAFLMLPSILIALGIGLALLRRRQRKIEA